MVSIIIPLYNVENFIERCANSLFGQTYPDIEYVFVDDCCSDSTVDILMRTLEYYPKRKNQVKLIRHSTNMGVAAARNSGLSVVSGDYVYYVDGDDWIDKSAIELMVARSKNASVDIVVCGWYLTFDKNERRMPMPFYSDVEAALRGMLSGQIRWNLWLYMIKRNLYHTFDIHYMAGQDVGEDMMVLIKLFSRAKSISFVDCPLYHYVKQNAHSITAINPNMQLKRLMANLNDVIDYLTVNFGTKYDLEINFLKLNAKMPLLITDDESSYCMWTEYFPEANKYIMRNKMQSIRMRLVQYMAANGYFVFVKLYYRLVFKFVYGFLYR